ncbi:glycosyltransferase [Enterococcus sp. LJL99]
MPYKIVITIVLYENEFADTPSYLLLKKLLEQGNYSLLIYDNSKHKQTNDFFDNERVHYMHDPSNPGLAKAYNAAKKLLFEINADFLLLLDQDTLLSEDYIAKIEQLHPQNDIGAFVPIVQCKGRQISPVFNDDYVSGQSSFPKAGKYEAVMAINSGTVLPKETLELLGEFNLDFPLDYLDHWLFWEIGQKQKKIKVLDTILEHDLSVLNYRTVTIGRYESIISAETLFYKKYQIGKFSTYKKHLLLRALKQFLTVKNRKIWHRTVAEYLSLMRGE